MMTSRQVFPIVVALVPLFGGGFIAWGHGGGIFAVGLWATMLGIGQAIVETIKAGRHAA